MRRIINSTYITIDGVIEEPQNSANFDFVDATPLASGNVILTYRVA